MTVSAGAFTAPTATRAATPSPQDSMVRSTALSESESDNIIPAVGCSPISRPRSHTNCVAVRASSAPANTTAQNSPREWPSRSHGVHPRAVHMRPIAYSTAKRHGCTNCGSWSKEALISSSEADQIV
uniref:Uncharacterized protein n=1 Tax=Chrysotila carterae TaxID=13221 RepID=A0A7S4C3G3_CHRCT